MRSHQLPRVLVIASGVNRKEVFRRVVAAVRLSLVNMAALAVFERESFPAASTDVSIRSEHELNEPEVDGRAALAFIGRIWHGFARCLHSI